MIFICICWYFNLFKSNVHSNNDNNVFVYVQTKSVVFYEKLGLYFFSILNHIVAAYSLLINNILYITLERLVNLVLNSDNFLFFFPWALDNEVPLLRCLSDFYSTWTSNNFGYYSGLAIFSCNFVQYILKNGIIYIGTKNDEKLINWYSTFNFIKIKSLTLTPNNRYTKESIWSGSQI